MEDKLKLWWENADYFVSTLNIQGVDSKLARFSPNPQQHDLLQAIQDNRITVVLKARQLGISTLAVSYLFWKWYTSPDPINILSVTDTYSKTRNMMKMFETFYSSLPRPLQRPLSTDNTERKVLADTGATFNVMTAGAKGGVRSGTIQIAHLSEFAFYPDPEEFMSTLSAALHDGKMIIESTANYDGDCLQDFVELANESPDDMAFMFFPWFTLDSYRDEAALTSPISQEEQYLRDTYFLDDKQLSWRRRKLKELKSTVKFKREYPSTIQEAYESTEGQYFDDLSKVSEYVGAPKSADIITIEEPQRGVKYTLGADPSGGTGNDPASIVVLNAITEQPAYIWRDNSTSPKDQAHHIHHIASKYNNALVVVESNNHGHTVLNELEHLGYGNLWTDEGGKPFLTTTKSKTLLMNKLRTRIVEEPITVDHKTLQELRSWKDIQDKPVFLGNTGHGDTTIALALSVWGLQDLTVRQELHPSIKRAQQRARKQNIAKSFNIGRRY